MNLVIKSPRFSFLRFGATESADECCDSEEFNLPVIDETDLVFQITVICETAADANTLYLAADDQAYLQLLSAVGPSVVAKDFLADGLHFEKYITGVKEITYFWRHPLAGFQALIACGQCFWLAFFIKPDIGVPANDQQVVSNRLNRACATCYTTILEFYSDEDYDEFRYCNVTDGFNRVRLPIHLNQPQFPEEGGRYRLSNGAIKVTKNTISKEYSGTTEFFPEHIHEKLKVALSHDEVAVAGDKYQGGISGGSDYKIEWEGNMCMAPATFKAIATPYVVRNNNCADCDTDFGCLVLEDFVMGYNVYDPGTDTQKFTFNWTAPPDIDFIRIEYRLAGSSDPWVAYTLQNNIPPVELVGFALGEWEFRASIVSEDCIRTWTDVIGPVGMTEAPDDCEAVGVVTVSGITATTADGSWPASSPTPALLYDWELRMVSADILIDSDTGHWNPGSLLIALSGLVSGTQYYLRVRAHCDADVYSAWSTSANFETL